MIWKPGAKRKFYDPKGRGWIFIALSKGWSNGMNKPTFKSWSMSVVRKNGASYWTVYAKTRRELFGLMRLEIAMKKNPNIKVVHNKLTASGKQGKQTKRMDNPFADHGSGQW